MRHLFYDSSEINLNSSPERMNFSSYSVLLWHPSINKIFPPGLHDKKFIIWWLFHYLRIFANRYYSVMLVFDKENTLVHRSCIFPRYFRFPFMCENDLQIGDTFTALKFRGEGIATWAILKIIELLKTKDRKFWYLCAEDNLASIRVIEKAGFKKKGSGIRTAKWGFKMLGSFIITETV